MTTRDVGPTPSKASKPTIHSGGTKLTRCLVAAAWALTALAQSRVKKDEAEMSGVIRTARIIQVLPEMNQLNESARDRSDASKIMRLRQHILEKVVAASPQVDANRADRQRDRPIQRDPRLSFRQKGQGCQSCQSTEYRFGGNAGSDELPGSSCFRERTRLRRSSASPLV